MRNDKLERVYFRIPSICKNLTTKSKKDMMWNVKRDNQQDKIEDFFDRYCSTRFTSPIVNLICTDLLS